MTRPYDLIQQARVDAANPRLTTNCLACNREKGWPMCSLCAKLEAAEREAKERDARTADS